MANSLVSPDGPEVSPKPRKWVLFDLGRRVLRYLIQRVFRRSTSTMMTESRPATTMSPPRRTERRTPLSDRELREMDGLSDLDDDRSDEIAEPLRHALENSAPDQLHRLMDLSKNRLLVGAAKSGFSTIPNDPQLPDNSNKARMKALYAKNLLQHFALEQEHLAEGSASPPPSEHIPATPSGRSSK